MTVLDEPATASPLADVWHAQRRWEEAGLAARLAVLQEAGRRLAERRSELDAWLRADGLSQRLAAYYGDWIVHQGDATLLQRYAWHHTRHEDVGGGGELLFLRPDGVVLLVVPGNSPTINTAPLFSLLLPGNAVLARAPQNDGGMRFIAHDIVGATLADHGFDARLVGVVTGRTRPFLDRFLPAPEARTVVFFGNSTAGHSVAERALALGKKAVLELEGSDHMLIWRDADVDAAAASALRAFDFSTQPCPIPKHLLVHGSAADAVLERFLQLVPFVSRTVPADPVDGMLVPVGRPDAFEIALAEVRDLGHIRCGGYRMDEHGERRDDGRFVAPTVVELDASTVLSRPLRCFDEEITFPLIPLVRCATDDELALQQMTSIASSSAFGLRASVWTREPERIAAFTRALGGTGLLLFNDDHAQCPVFVSPWGGPGRSGGASGEHHLFWQKTSRLQAIGARQLDRGGLDAVLGALGVVGDARRPGAVHAPELAAGVRLSIADSVATLMLDRPDRHNAVDGEMVRALARALDEVEADDQVGAVLVMGSGRSFCSGADLAMLSQLDASGARRFMLDATWVFRRLQRLPIPVLAAVHGYCLGGGLELALHCDEIVVDDTAVFGLPEVGAGFVTTAGSVQRLSDALGSFAARRLLLGADRLDAAGAVAQGLASAIAPGELLAEAATARARQLAALPRHSVAAMKGLLLRGTQGRDDASWVSELAAFDGLIRRQRP